MKKQHFILFAVIFTILAIPAVLALNIKVEKLSTNEAMIADLNKQAKFDLRITNLGSPDNIEFYNLLGFKMFPIGTTFVGGQPKDITLEISPIGSIRERGHYTLTYFIRGQNKDEQQQEITFEIIDLKDAFEIGSGNIEPETGVLEIYIHNKENFNFGNMNAKF